MASTSSAMFHDSDTSGMLTVGAGYPASYDEVATYTYGLTPQQINAHWIQGH
jgi:hypothetical protein